MYPVEPEPTDEDVRTGRPGFVDILRENPRYLHTVGHLIELIRRL